MPRAVVSVGLLVLVLGGCSGCANGGRQSPRAPVVQVSIWPVQAEVVIGGKVRFSADVEGTADGTVHWSVLEPDGGSIDASGTYTAPTTAGRFTVQAGSSVVSTAFARAQVDVVSRGVSIDPSQATVRVGERQQFTATTAGVADRRVLWSVREVGGGTVDVDGLYTAPAAPGAFTVRARSVADPSLEGSARVTVSEPVVVEVEPPRAEVRTNARLRFTARLTGGVPAGVRWSVLQAGGGTIDGEGVYSAPGSPGTFTVVATSLGDPTASGAATVDVRAAVTVEIEPALAEVPAGTQRQFIAHVTGTGETGVDWSVVEPDGGTVSAGGLYTAPATPGNYTVRATSAADPTSYATAVAVVPSSTDPTGVLPVERTTRWNPGLNAVGGIPTRTTVFRTLSPSGADDTASIQAALDACPPDQVVKLTAGTFRISGEGLSIRRSGVTLRGDGPDRTRLEKVPGTEYPVVIIGLRWFGYTDGVNLAQDARKGARTAVLGAAPPAVAGEPLRPGEIVVVDQVTDPGLTLWSERSPPGDDSRSWFGRPDRPIGQVMEVESVNGLAVTFTTPFHIDFRTANQAQLVRYGRDAGQELVKYSGIEDLYVSYGEGGDGGGNIHLFAASYSWVKNVESQHSGGTAVNLDGTFRCVLRDSYLHSTVSPNPGGGGYGIGLNAYAADNLVENNISWNFNKVMLMRKTGGGNVVAYNYLEDGWGAGYPDLPETGLNAAHMTTPHHELLEGNQAFNFASDSVWGNSIYITVYRNHLTGLRRSIPPLQLSDTINRRFAEVTEGHWWYSFVGNVLGYQGMSPAPYPSFEYEDDFDGSYTARIWAIGVADGGQDRVVAERTLRHGNYDFFTRQTAWDPATTRRDLPPSLYLTAKPAFFGARPWPWVTPENAAAPLGALPARERFDQIHGPTGRR